jgi:hypothetical protein
MDRTKISKEHLKALKAVRKTNRFKNPAKFVTRFKGVSRK